MFARAIVLITACCLAQNGTCLVMDMRIEHGHITISTLRCWDSELACECSDICTVQGQKLLYMYTYTQNVPNSKHLGKQSNMRL